MCGQQVSAPGRLRGGVSSRVNGGARRVQRQQGQVVMEGWCPQELLLPKTCHLAAPCSPWSRATPGLKTGWPRGQCMLGLVPAHIPPSFAGPLDGRQSGLWMGEDTPLCRVARTACRGPVGPGALARAWSQQLAFPELSLCARHSDHHGPDPTILPNPGRMGLLNPIYRWQNRGSDRESNLYQPHSGVGVGMA